MSHQSPSAQARRRLFQHAEGWFQRGQAALLESLPCRPGCTRCCYGPFAITLLDQLELQQGLQALSPPIQSDIHARAQSQMETMEEAFPRLRQSPYIDEWKERELDDLVTRFSELPCPALDSDGRCLVYTSRPLTCRMMGLPVESNGLVYGACEVQTFVPVIRVSEALRQEEDRLAKTEARLIEEQRHMTSHDGEEVLLPYGFLSPSVV
ncbi:MAG TPA: YkgJ family cysteine cluster protein [Nitrospiraceae bacterium]|nr:YkgJ family cysteine cluster protein [Nitrospiraceae bacterium]